MPRTGLCCIVEWTVSRDARSYPPDSLRANQFGRGLQCKRTAWLAVRQRIMGCSIALCSDPTRHIKGSTVDAQRCPKTRSLG